MDDNKRFTDSKGRFTNGYERLKDGRTVQERLSDGYLKAQERLRNGCERIRNGYRTGQERLRTAIERRRMTDDKEPLLKDDERE